MTDTVSPPNFRVRLVCAAILLAPLLALPPSLAWAEGTSEQRTACTPDALRLCASEIPDVAKITACMKSHMTQLSPRCRAAFNEPAAPKPETKPVTKTAETPVVKAKPRVATRDERLDDKREPRGPARATLARVPARARGAVASRDERRPERPIVATREERRSPREIATERPIRPARAVARAPRDDDSDFANPLADASPIIVASPAAPEPLGTPGIDNPRVTLANMCRRGLIDSYTCANTVPTLGLGE